jgi:hypothetical protein
MKIADFLAPGQENATPLRQLVAMTGRDGRVVRAMIARERLNGTPILADNMTGYYLPACDAERLAFIRSMRHRAAEILRAARAIEAGADK